MGDRRPGRGPAATEADREWLREAIELSRRCPPSASAFSVGAVIVAADGGTLATGFSRQRDPHDHAEEGALATLDPGDPRLPGATLYSSLEPCRFRASRPRPCAELIMAAGVLRRVVIAWLEPPVFAQGGARSCCAHPRSPWWRSRIWRPRHGPSTRPCSDASPPPGGWPGRYSARRAGQLRILQRGPVAHGGELADGGWAPSGWAVFIPAASATVSRSRGIGGFGPDDAG